MKNKGTPISATLKSLLCIEATTVAIFFMQRREQKAALTKVKEGQGRRENGQ